MLTEKPKGAEAAKPATHHAAPPTDELVAYFEGDYVSLKDANVNIMTHAFMYGTAVFEGIRAYWNEDQGVLYGLKLREHMERIRRNAGILLMHDLPPVDELVRIVVETVRRNGFREDAYIRPCYYKAGQSIGVRLHNLPHRADRARAAVRQLRRHGQRPPGHDLDLASQRGRRAAGARQDRRRLREHGVPEVRGRAQRLRRGARPHGRRPRVGGVGREHVRRPRRRPHDPAGERRHPRGRHPQGDPGARRGLRDPDRAALDRPLRDLRRRRDVPVRHGRPARAGDRARPPPDRRRRHRPDHASSSTRRTTPRSAAGTRASPTG